MSLTSLNYDDLEDKMKGTYKLAPVDFEDTYGIVNTAPGIFGVYIDPCLKENELWKLPHISRKTPQKTGPGPSPL